MATNSWIGRSLGNYVVRSLIGQGGVGMVFAGEHRFLGDRVAIKVLRGGGDSELGRRFFSEARTTRAVDHPNVIRILDFGKDDSEDVLYLVMELLEGESLASVVKRGRMNEGDAVHVAAAIADGLHAAHEKGVVHRDLKPGNIFLCSDGRVKVLDFGLAKFIQSGNRTATGVVLGTPQYLAPEQARAASSVGPRSDIYSLGAVMFRMVTGQLPFAAQGMAEMISAHLFAKPRKPSELAPVTPETEALILQCLEKDPNARPPSMAAVSDRLRASTALPSEGGSTIVDSRIPSEILSMGDVAEMAAQAEPEVSANVSSKSMEVIPGSAESSAAAGEMPEVSSVIEVPAALVEPEPSMTPGPVVTTTLPGTTQPARLPLRIAALGGALVLASVIGFFTVRYLTRAPANDRPLAAAHPVVVETHSAATTPQPHETPVAPSAKPPEPVAARPPEPPAPVTPRSLSAALDVLSGSATAAATSVAAAASSPVSELAIIKITSDPPGAAVQVGAEAQGTTPVELHLKLPAQVILSYSGFLPEIEQIKSAGSIHVKMRKAIVRRPIRPRPGPKQDLFAPVGDP